MPVSLLEGLCKDPGSNDEKGDRGQEQRKRGPPADRADGRSADADGPAFGSRRNRRRRLYVRFPHRTADQSL